MALLRWLAFALVALGGCSRDGLPPGGVSDGGGADPYPLCVMRDFGPESIAHCTATFGGAATGEWSGCLLRTQVMPAEGQISLGIVTTEHSGPTGNVRSLPGFGFAFHELSAATRLDLDSPEVIEGIVGLTLQDGTSLVTLKDELGDAGVRTAGSMSLGVDSVEVRDGCTWVHGRFDVMLVNNDPMLHEPTALMHVEF